MEWLRKYIITVLALAIVGLIAESLLPKGKLKKYAVYAFSVILSIGMLQPLIELKNNNDIPDIKINEAYVDYLSAVKSTVNSIEGYENAKVFVQQEGGSILSITIKTEKGMLKDEAEKLINKNEVKKLLCALYGVKKGEIFISE